MVHWVLAVGNLLGPQQGSYAEAGPLSCCLPRLYVSNQVPTTAQGGLGALYVLFFLQLLLIFHKINSLI